MQNCAVTVTLISVRLHYNWAN